MPNGRNQNGGTTVILTSPIGGVVRAISREEQPEGTAVDALNVLPYSLDGRRRISQRYGISQFCSTSTGDPIQGMLPIGYILTPGSPWIPVPSITIPTSFVPSIFGPGTVISSGGPSIVNWVVQNGGQLDIKFTLSFVTTEASTYTAGLGYDIGGGTPFNVAFNFYVNSTTNLGGPQAAGTSGQIGAYFMGNGHGPSTVGIVPPILTLPDPGSHPAMCLLAQSPGGIYYLLASTYVILGSENLTGSATFETKWTFSPTNNSYTQIDYVNGQLADNFSPQLISYFTGVSPLSTTAIVPSAARYGNMSLS